MVKLEGKWAKVSKWAKQGRLSIKLTSKRFKTAVFYYYDIQFALELEQVPQTPRLQNYFWKKTETGTTADGFIYLMVPTNPYAAVSHLSGLAEVIVDAGKKATPHQATIGDD